MQLKFTNLDGFVFDLFNFLWLKDPITKKAPNLNIPYTIQFQAGQAKFWYFTKQQILLRKTKEKLDPEYLKKVFNSQDSTKIEASWIYEENGKLKFNYMTSQQTSQFIEKLDYNANGVLQEFIPAKGEFTSTIKCIWQKNYCIFESIKNLNKINKRNLTPSQKIQTFESDGGPTISSTLNSNTLGKVLENLCQEIALHISNVTFEKINITLMELYFRQTDKDQIYLLFCSKIRTSRQKSSSNSEIRFSLKVPLSKGPNRIEMKNQRCVGCKIIQNINTFEEIQIREIIESWDRYHEIKYRQDPPLIEMDQNCLIPKVLRFIYPNLNFKHYQALKSNLAFIIQKITLCQKCYKEIKDDKSHFHRATYSIQQKILMRQRSTQSSMLYDTQSIKKSQKSLESIAFNSTESQSKSQHNRRSISTTAYTLKYRCNTLFFNNSISQIFKNEQSQNLS